MTYGTYHASEIEGSARWGARLIAREVEMGLPGLVGNRQAGSGELANQLVALIKHTGALEQLLDAARDELDLLHGGDDEITRVEIDDELNGHRLLGVACPQGSHGYLYVSFVLDPEEAQR